MPVTADPIDDLVAHVIGGAFKNIPAAAVDAARTLLLDTLANGVAGASAPGAAAMLAATQSDSGAGSVALWGRRECLAARDAALLNAYQIHCLEFDCVHEGAVLHPLTPLVAAMVADMDRLDRVSGEAFLTALILGVDVTCNIALASTVASPFFRTGSAAAFGATAACARLRGFDAATTVSALGLVYEQCGSSRQAHTEGTSIMGLLAGFAARNALFACDLAEQGVRGPIQVLTGPYGYLNLYEGRFAIEPVWKTLGRQYRIQELAQKPYPSGRPTHMFVDAAKALIARYGIEAADVVSGICRMPPTVKALVGRPVTSGMSPNYARLCTPYCVAAALTGGDLTQADFSPAAIQRADVTALAARMSVAADDNPDPNAMGPATLSLQLARGEVVEHTVEYALGHPKNPMNPEQRLEKFWSCWQLNPRGPGPAQGNALLEQIEQLETVDNVAGLSQLLTAS